MRLTALLSALFIIGHSTITLASEGAVVCEVMAITGQLGFTDPKVGDTTVIDLKTLPSTAITFKSGKSIPLPSAMKLVNDGGDWDLRLISKSKDARAILDVQPTETELYAFLQLDQGDHTVADHVGHLFMRCKL